MARYQELIYDPIGHLFDGTYQSGAYGGHTDHVHVALARHPKLLLSLLLWAQNHGLNVRENPYFDAVDPVHTEGSFHYQQFNKRFHGHTLGKAGDVSGSAAQMAHFFELARKRLESGNPVRRALMRAGYSSGGRGRGGGPAHVAATHGGGNVPMNLGGVSPAVLTALLQQQRPAPVSPVQQLASLQAGAPAGLSSALSPQVAENQRLDAELKALRARLLSA